MRGGRIELALCRERWWELGVDVWELCVHVWLFTVTLTIWPGFLFRPSFEIQTPQGLRLYRVFFAQVYYPYYSPIAVSQFPRRDCRLVYNISNDVQMLLNKCFLYFPNGGAKNNAQSPDTSEFWWVTYYLSIYFFTHDFPIYKNCREIVWTF